MKIQWDKKYTTIAVYAFLTAAAIGIFVAALFNFSFVGSAFSSLISILLPFIVGFVAAYLILPIVNFFENMCFGKIKPMKKLKRLNRILSVSLAYIIFFAFLFLFAYVVIPELYSSLLAILSNMDSYATSITVWIKDVFYSNENLLVVLDKITVYVTDLSENIINSALPYLASIATDFLVGLKNAAIGLIIAFYILLRREMFIAQIKKINYALFSKKTADRLVYITGITDKSFSGFISGKLIDSLIIGIITYIFMMIFGWPYPVLISVIIGVTNILPFFGPFIGGIPSFLIILMINPWQAVFFGIFIIILQQIDGNILGPKILGKTVGISAIWVVFAIIVGGGLFGFVGMVVGVPLFCVFYTIFKEYITNRLEKKNLSTDTNDYKKVQG